ncbi:MAG: hypothetical protein R3F50_09715 [Gammaproteobacteria bacterium]|jgi:hypothetical protein
MQHALAGSQRPVRYAADGLLRIQGQREDSGLRAGEKPGGKTVELHFSLSPKAGHHVTTGTVGGQELSPLAVELMDDEKHWVIERCEVRETSDLLAQSGQSVDDSAVQVSVTLAATSEVPDLLSASVGLRLQVQLCSDTACLAPQQFSFRL